MLKSEINKLIQGLSGDAGVIIGGLPSGEIIEFNKDEQFPAASVIKLTILWELFQRVENKEFALDDEIKLEDGHKVGGFGILKELHAGTVLTVKDLATLMIVLSDNVATNMLIDKLGMEAINKTIQANGITGTVLQRKMMDAEAKKRGLDNFTSPAGIYKLLKMFLDPAKLGANSTNEMLEILKKQQCNNKLPLYMPPETVLAHKTGDLPGTEHDVGILFTKKGPVIIVVMTKNLSNNFDGINFINEIGRICCEYFNQ